MKEPLVVHVPPRDLPTHRLSAVSRQTGVPCPSAAPLHSSPSIGKRAMRRWFAVARIMSLAAGACWVDVRFPKDSHSPHRQGRGHESGGGIRLGGPGRRPHGSQAKARAGFSRRGLTAPSWRLGKCGQDQPFPLRILGHPPESSRGWTSLASQYPLCTEALQLPGLASHPLPAVPQDTLTLL